MLSSLTAIAGTLALGALRCESATGTHGPLLELREDASTPDASDGPPTLWTCPPKITLPPDTTHGSYLNVPFEGNNVCDGGVPFESCGYAFFIPCANDSNQAWSCQATCHCREQWVCDSCPWLREPCVAPSKYVCPTEPLTYVSVSEQASLLPSGACNSGEHCFLRTRQSCATGTIGVTSAFDCTCVGDEAPRVWKCDPQWHSQDDCDVLDGGIVSIDAGTGGIPNGEPFWIEVQDDGAPIELAYDVTYYGSNGCVYDNLEGWFDAETVPTISVSIWPAGPGLYYDGHGDPWSLTVTSILLDDSKTRDGQLVTGTLTADAVGSSGVTEQLTIVFQARYQAPTTICD